MKQFLKQFTLRGLVGMGFGPLVLAVIYACIGTESVPMPAAARGIVSLTALAFLCGGMTGIYTVEKLPALTAALIHGAILYIGYLIMYLCNDWIPRNTQALVIFTVIFVVIYAVIWAVIYVINRRKTAELNAKLHHR